MADKHFPTLYQRAHVQIGQTTYVTRIEDFDDDTLTIATPREVGQNGTIQIGMAIHLAVVAENGLYSFTTLVREVRRDGRVPVLILSKPAAPQRIQRRSHFRVQVALSVTFQMLPDSEGEPPQPPQKGFTRNISGGGMLLAIEKTVLVRKRVELKVYMPDCVINATGQVVSIRPSLRGGDAVEVGIQFTHISEKNRERIIRLVFENQRATAYAGWQ